MSNAYVSQLKREQEAAQSIPPSAPSGLSERFIKWFEGLPEISQQRHFSMSELEKATASQGKYLSTILLQLGWQRRRKWTSTGRYPRYWVPPTLP